MIDPKFLKEYDEWERERLEILENVHFAVMSGEITPEQADELRKELKP